MDGIMLVCGLLGALAVIVGIARLVAWGIDRREEQGTKAIRDAVCVAQARAEFLRTPSQIRHAAQIADREYTTEMLDQQDMGDLEVHR